MMRIAIAGSGGLAQHFARHLNETVHPFIILSRSPKPQLEELGYQILAVDYNSQDDLRFALRGIDLVISTVSGTPQINLIDAAAHSRVRRFVPAEFEGPPSRRPSPDPLDQSRGRAATLDRLRHYNNRQNRHHMRSTLFICGIFYEWFARGGLASKGVALGSGMEHQGAFLMDVGNHSAEIVKQTERGEPLYLCLTSINDLAKYVVAALDLGIENWPGEFKVRGERRTVAEIVSWAEAARGGAPGMLFTIVSYNKRDLPAHLNHAQFYQDFGRVAKMQSLIATADGRYDFSTANLNEMVDVEPQSFWNWLSTHWGTQ